MANQTEQRQRLYREKEREAIALATQGRWEEAVRVNRLLLDLFPNDVNALNRLGKALMELGRYPEAREAFQRALQVSPSNSIARKNLERLSQLEARGGGGRPRDHVAPPHLFIEESGKTCVTSLEQVASPEVLAQVAAGDTVHLQPQQGRVVVTTTTGQYLGLLEPKLARRLTRLMEGGNRYMAAVASVDPGRLDIVIREVYQHPSLVGVASFPSRIEDYSYFLPLEEDLEPEDLESEALSPDLVEGEEEGEEAAPVEEEEDEEEM